MKRILIIAIILMSFLSGKALSKEIHIPKVLIVQSYHSGFLWSDNIDTAIKTTLKNYNNNIRIKTEYLDTKRFNTPFYKDNLQMMLEFKYIDSDFDLIITADNNAFDLVKKLHKSVFKEIPVVFCGVNYFHPSQLEGMKNVTGVREKIVSLENFKLIKSIHKNVKKIIVLNEKTPTGEQNRVNILADIREFKEDVDIEIIDDISIADLKVLLRSLDHDTVVLYSLFFKDGDGKFLEYDESAIFVSRYSAVPVYVSIDFSLGFGAIGGFLTSGSLQGESAAKLAIQILEGQDAEKLDIIDVSPNGYYFDYEAMQKWGIKLSDIPEDSQLINYKASYFRRNKELILKFLLVVLILSAIIILLIVTLIKKNKLKNQLIKSNSSLTELTDKLEILVDERTQELKNEEEKYRSVYENTGIAMFTIGEDDLVSMVNQRFEDLSGYTKDEIINKLPWQTFVDSVDLARVSKKREMRLANKLPLTDAYDVKFVNKKGYVIDSLLNVVLVSDTREVICSITDISEKNAIHNKMKLLLEEQKAFNESKNKFYKNFSEDLKIPLESIYGIVDLIENCSIAKNNDDFYKLLKDLTSQILYITKEMTDYQISDKDEQVIIQEVYIPEFIKYIGELFTERSNIDRIYYRIDKDLHGQNYFSVKKLEKLLEIIIIKIAKSNPKIPLVIDAKKSDNEKIRFRIYSQEHFDNEDFIMIQNENNKHVHDLNNISELRFNYMVINRLVSLLEGEIDYSRNIDHNKEFIFTIKSYTENDISSSANDEDDVNNIEKYILPPDISDISNEYIGLLDPLKVIIVNYNNVSHYVLYNILDALNQKIEMCSPEEDLKELLKQNTYDAIIIDLSQVSINNLETLKEIKKMDNIYIPYIIADTENIDTSDLYEGIDAELPDILTCSNLYLLLKSALEYKNRD